MTVNLTKSTFASTVTDNSVVLVDFWASWCGPCRAFAPVFDQSARAHPDIVHAKVNTEAEPEIAAWFGIRSIPTVMAFRDGVIVYDRPGALTRDMLADVIRQARDLDMDSARAQIAAYDAGTGRA